MRRIKKVVVGLFIFLTYNSYAQLGIGIKAGFQQAIPLVMRDSFSGRPTISTGANLYIPFKPNMNFVTGLSYRVVSVSHKVEVSNLTWQAMGINLGTEWFSNKLINTSFYTGINAEYILVFRKNVLSSNTSSGSSFIDLPVTQKLVPSLEAGIMFTPRPHININFSLIQPIPQTIKDGKPTLPGTLSVSIGYRLTSDNIKSWKNDTTPEPEKKFSKALRAGTLYFIEDGSDSAVAILHKMIADNYDYSKVGFIKKEDLKTQLSSFLISPDSNLIFVAKTGAIVYDIGRASTQGLIVYNYKMENPVPKTPLFVRNLAGDSEFEDPLVIKKIIKTLNNRLYRMYNTYK